MLAVLLLTTIGARPSTMLTTLGTRTSTMAIRTTTIRLTQTMFVAFGILNKTLKAQIRIYPGFLLLCN